VFCKVQKASPASRITLCALQRCIVMNQDGVLQSAEGVTCEPDHTLRAAEVHRDELAGGPRIAVRLHGTRVDTWTAAGAGERARTA
jgi:hypothetical protein